MHTYSNVQAGTQVHTHTHLYTYTHTHARCPEHRGFAATPPTFPTPELHPKQRHSQRKGPHMLQLLYEPHTKKDGEREPALHPPCGHAPTAKARGF